MASKKENLILAAVAILILAVVSAAGRWVWTKFAPPREENKISIANLAEELKTEELKNKENDKEEQRRTEEAALLAVKETTSAPADVNVKILNGGAPAGSAARVADLLKTQGYTRIEAANANLSSYSGVTIYCKTVFKNEAETIKENLAGRYKTIVLKEKINTREAGGDVAVILGK